MKNAGPIRRVIRSIAPMSMPSLISIVSLTSMLLFVHSDTVFSEEQSKLNPSEYQSMYSVAFAPDEPLQVPEIYFKAWEKDPQPNPMMELADLEFAKKNFKRALDRYSDFVGKYPAQYDGLRATIQMSECHYQLRDYDSALKVLDDFLATRPGSFFGLPGEDVIPQRISWTGCR